MPKEPEPDVLADGRLAGERRLAAEPPPQVIGQGIGRAVASGRVALQALQADGLELAIHGAIQRAGRDDLAFDHQAPGSPHRSCPCKGASP